MATSTATRLSPTHYLLLSLLAATQKPGHWATLPSMVRPALRALAEQGLVTWQQGSGRACEAVLTEAGREAAEQITGQPAPARGRMTG